MDLLNMSAEEVVTERRRRSAYNARYYVENVGRELARSAKYRAENREAARAAGARWRLKNRERIKAYSREWREANPELSAALTNAWRAANRDRTRQYNAMYQKANPEKKQARDHRRRARKRAAEGSHTGEELRVLLAVFDGQCAYCERDIKRCATFDHAVPLCRGGTDNIDNLLPACRRCNSSKRDRTALEFLLGVARRASH